MNRWLKVGIVLVALLVAALAAVYFLVNANTFRPLLESQMSTALGRKTTLGHLSFSPFSGSLVADDLQIADDPAYSSTPFLTAKQLRIGVAMRPLIFSRKLVVESFTAESPDIHLVRGAAGNWNFSSIGKNAASRAGNAQQESAFPDLSVGSIDIHDGRASVEFLAAPGQPQVPARVYDNVELSVQQFSFARQFPFSVSASLPAQGKVAVTGTAGPINQQNAAMTAFHAKVTITHLDPVAAGFLDPSAGVSLLADVDASVASDGQRLTSSGTAHLQHLRLVKSGAPTPNPVNLTYDIAQSLNSDDGQIHSATVQTGAVALHIAGTYQLVPKNPVVNVTVNGQGMPIDQLQALIRSAGVHLPNGSVLQGGTMNLAMAVSGPANNLVITGPLELDNTRLAGFDIGSRISGLAALGGIKTGDATDIHTLRLNLHSSSAGIATDNIYADMPAVGQATGSGTVSPAGALDYNLVVKVNTAQGLGKAGVGLLTKLNGFAGSTAQSAAANGVPMRVTGTASNPVITADVSGLMKRNVNAIFGTGKKGSAGSLLQGLFGKR